MFFDFGSLLSEFCILGFGFLQGYVRLAKVHNIWITICSYIKKEGLVDVNLE